MSRKKRPRSLWCMSNKPAFRDLPITLYLSDAFSKNFIDYEEYPVSADIQNRSYIHYKVGGGMFTEL